MFDKRNFLLCALTQFLLIGLSMEEKKSKFDRHKSSLALKMKSIVWNNFTKKETEVSREVVGSGFR
jgi:hypothetical protein